MIAHATKPHFKFQNSKVSALGLLEVYLPLDLIGHLCMSGVVLLSFNVRELDLFTNIIDIREIEKFVESSEANSLTTP
jgi:hypothetical protein